MKLTTIIREKWAKSKWGPVFFWSLLIFVGSSLPPVSIRPDTFLDFFLHKSAHFFEYFVLTWLTWRATRAVNLSLLLPIFYAFTDEAHQSFVQGRMGRGQDILWDSLAVIWGTLFIMITQRLKRRESSLLREAGLSGSIEETHYLAERVLSRLGERNLLALSGDLGSGKTVFVQGLAKALGLRETVSSPSFVLVKEYPLPKPVGLFKKLVHVDLYRLNSAEAVENLRLTDWLEDAGNLVVVEWAERWHQLPLRKTVKVYLSYMDEGRRRWRLETG